DGRFRSASAARVRSSGVRQNSRRPARGIAFVTLEQRIAEELRLSQCIAPQVVFCLTCSQTLEITTEPSPTAEATRFTDPARTSPTAKMPGNEAARGEGGGPAPAPRAS